MGGGGMASNFQPSGDEGGKGPLEIGRSKNGGWSLTGLIGKEIGAKSLKKSWNKADRNVETTLNFLLSEVSPLRRVVIEVVFCSEEGKILTTAGESSKRDSE